VSREYRPDIDGLRAIAVSAVVLFHAFPTVLKGGYVGVDVFFVISGFLIGGVVFNDTGTRRLSLQDFYVRRIRRIFPGLIVVLLSCLSVGWFVLPPTEFVSLGKHVIGGSGFVSNLVLWRESGYFDTSAELKPLLHLWSLGVEEQFYIIFPLLTLMIVKLRLHRRFIIGTALIASLIYCVMTSNSNPTAAFYSPATRMWEILVGVLMADLITDSKFRFTNPATRSTQSVLGVILLGYSIVSFDSQTTFPGWHAMYPTVGAALVIWAGPTSLINKHLLSLKPAVLVGLISYPLYLWHWPILVFLRVHLGHTPSSSVRTLAVLTSLVAAYLTYALIERFFRFRLAPRHAVRALFTGTACVVIVGALVIMNQGLATRYSGQLRELATFKPNFELDARSPTCWVDQFSAPTAFSKECFTHSSTKANWLIWGDSHAARLYPGLKSSLPQGIELSQLTKSSCPAVLKIEFSECQASNKRVMSLIKAKPPEVVVMFGRWETYLRTKTFENFETQFRLTVKELHKAGVRKIYVLGQAPFWSGSLPTNMIDYLKETGSKSLPVRTNFRLTPIAADTERLFLRVVKATPSVRYFSLVDALCRSGKCLVTIDGTVNGLISWDYGHLTTPGATYVSQLFLRFVGQTD
jgi:peptidoglycan/LPS O-acetylase OafA/YrhL